LMSYNPPPNQGFVGGFSGSPATGSCSGFYGQHPGGVYAHPPRYQFDSRGAAGSQGDTDGIYSMQPTFAGHNKQQTYGERMQPPMVPPGNQSRLVNPASIGANASGMVGMPPQHMMAPGSMQRSPAAPFHSNVAVVQRPPNFQQPILQPMPNPGSLHQVSQSPQQYTTIPKQPQPAVVGTQAAAVAAQPVHPQAAAASATASAPSSSGYSQVPEQLLTKKRLDDLVKEIDPYEQLDDDVKDAILNIADEFVESVISQACQVAKHRNAATVDVKDVQLVLERNYNMWIPGFGTDEHRPYDKSAVTEAHKSRMALINKTKKKH